MNGAGYSDLTERGESFAVARDWTDATTPSFAGEYRARDFGPLIDQALKAGHTVRIDDALADPRTSDHDIASAFVQAGKRAAIIAPLIRDGRMVASLYVHQIEPRHWRDDEVALVQEVAERTWTSALGRARVPGRAAAPSAYQCADLPDHSRNSSSTWGTNALTS
jgi:GAF domain-containing protein